MSWGARPTQTKSQGGSSWGATPSASSSSASNRSGGSSWGAKPSGSTGGWGSAKPSGASGDDSGSTATASGGGWGFARPKQASRNTGWSSAQAQSSVSAEDLKDANQTTSRILSKLEDTHMVADNTIDELVRQNEQLQEIQDDFAEIHNDINYSERKLASTKDFFGNLFKKKRTNYVKQRGKDEKEIAKERMEEARENSKIKDAEDHEQQKALAQERSTWASNASKDMRRAKAEGKANRKQGGGVGGGDGSFQSGDFMFVERTDGTGERVQAEDDLDTIYHHVRDLKTKAHEMGELGEESLRRVQALNEDAASAQARTRKNIEREDKLLK